MPAGHDFDALLMGALYGELSAVEESRLQAHLAAHPADQQTFHALTRTREAIRAGVAAAFVEPPQAISALLLQEAARRAPKSVRESRASEDGSRWLRWLSSLLAHPGLAAAAMVVVVVGVAGSMYLRGGAKLAESTAPSPSAASSPTELAQGDGIVAQDFSRVAATSGAGSAARADDPNAVALAEPPPPPPPALEAPGDAQAQNARDGYSVGLDGDVGGNTGNTGNTGSEVRRRGGPVAKPSKRPEYIEAKPVDDLRLKDFDDEDAKLAVKPAPKAAKESANEGKAKRESADRFEAADAEADSGDDELQAPQEERSGYASRGQKGGAASTESEKNQPATKPVPRAVTTPSASAGAAPSAPAAAPITSPATPPATIATSKADSSVAPSGTTAGAAAQPTNRKTPVAAAKPAEPINNISTVDKASDKKATDDSWAKGEHARLVRLAKANQCSEAAAVAGSIATRAPRYYQDEVANDRNLRGCSAAIRDQLNLQSEQSKRRSKSPARNSEAPAPSSTNKK